MTESHRAMEWYLSLYISHHDLLAQSKQLQFWRQLHSQSVPTNARGGENRAPVFPTSPSFVMSHFAEHAVAQWPWVLLGLCDRAE